MQGRTPHLNACVTTFAEINISNELAKRGARPPNFQTEAEAMRELASSLQLSPDEILQKLSETLLKLCHAHSAGVSVYEPKQNCFRWRAIAGQLAHFLGGTAPKDFSPCGVVVDEDRYFLLQKPERFYDYVGEMTIPCNEVLLMPFKQNGKVAGTVWVVFHNDHRKFDGEDVRLLSSLSSFASAAVQSSQDRTDALIAHQEAEHANTLKSAFLANMSHEIRTPLGAMIGFADLLRDSNLSPSTRANYIDVLIRNGETLSVVINDILDLSKVEAGHMVLEFTEMYPARIANEVISALRLKAEEKRLELKFTADPSTPKRFVTDSARLKQILLNLISNAIKFTPFGSVSIRSYGGVESESLYFEVTDTGIGIPESQHDKIFEMFVQADGSITRKFGGTGLGLALSRRLARALGGDVEIKNTAISKGSTFLVKVVSQASLIEKQESFPASEMDLPSAPNALEGVRVLVVDDALDNQDLISYYLERHGAIVESAENGKIAIQKALANKYDVVLMDVQMPEMDGYTATQKLRESGYPTPIIALTAHVMNEARQKCVNVGCSGYLPKPINSRELISMIARHARLN